MSIKEGDLAIIALQNQQKFAMPVVHGSKHHACVVCMSISENGAEPKCSSKISYVHVHNYVHVLM